MKPDTIGGFQVELNETAIHRWYAVAPVWDCGCGHCRNFLALARARRLPAELLEILDRLSVPPEKATYVCECGAGRAGRLYEIAYRLAGRIQNVPERPGPLTCGAEPAPGTAEDFPEPRFDLMLWTELPWSLDEPIEGPEEERT